MRRAIQGGSALLVLLVVLCGLVVVHTERVRFYEESTILATTAAFHHGQPLYTAAGAAAEYSLLYGPVTFFAYLPPMLVGAERLAAFEAWSLLALAGTFCFVFLTIRTLAGTTFAFLSTALAAAIVARVTGNVWAIKADVWILFFAALGLLAAVRFRPWVSMAFVAVAGAALLDLKPTLLLVALLPMVLLARRARTPALAAALVMPLLALLPFASSGVSLPGYAALLRDYSTRPTALAMLRLNVVLTLLILLPTLALLWACRKTPDLTAPGSSVLGQEGVYLGLLALAALVATVTGAKIGGGPWHCAVLILPCLALNAVLWRRLPHETSPALLAPFAAVVSALCLAALPALAAGVRERLHDPPGDTTVSIPAVEADLMTLMARHPGVTMQMGYSDRAHYNLTYVRPILQMRGNPLLLDGNARNEADLLHRPVAPALLDSLAHCTVRLWLIPRGGVPFSMESPYFLDPTVDRSRMQPALYPDDFRRVFLTHYHPTAEPDPYFTLWACNS